MAEAVDGENAGVGGEGAPRPSAFASFLHSPDHSEPSSPLPLAASEDGGSGVAADEQSTLSAACSWQRLGSAVAGAARRGEHLRTGSGSGSDSMGSPVGGDELASRLMQEQQAQGHRQLRDCSPLTVRPYGGVTPTASHENSPDHSPGRPL